MGLRFGKRITIIPGVRLNISKSGVSASVGPRGLSLTAGRRGVHLNAGIPGSGLSYRERLDRPSGSKRATGAASAFSGPVSISVDDAGAMSFTDSAGTPVPPAVVKRIKAEQAADIEALLHRAAEKANRDLEACLGVHLLTPAPDQTPKGLPDFAEPPPRAPQHKAPTLMDRLLLRAGKIERQHMEENTRYAEELSAWKAALEAHKVEQASVANAIRLAREGSREGMEDVCFTISGSVFRPSLTHWLFHLPAHATFHDTEHHCAKGPAVIVNNFSPFKNTALQSGDIRSPRDFIYHLRQSVSMRELKQPLAAPLDMGPLSAGVAH